MEQTTQQIESLINRISVLERNAIQLNIDPTTTLYLNKSITDTLNTILVTLPTQTYSLSTPSGVAPIGSVWFYDTGVLATREIYSYSGLGWVKFK